MVMVVMSQVARRSCDLETQLESENSHAPQPTTRSRPKLGKRAQIRATAIAPWQVTTMASTSSSDGGDGARRVGLGRAGQILTGLSKMGPDSEHNKRRRKSRAGAGVTHMLLYLNKETFVGEKGIKTDSRKAHPQPCSQVRPHPHTLILLPSLLTLLTLNRQEVGG